MSVIDKLCALAEDGQTPAAVRAWMLDVANTIYLDRAKGIEAMMVVAADPATPQAQRVWLKELVADLEDEDAQPAPIDDESRFIKGAPIPASLGAQADLYADVREKRLAMEKEAALVKDRETEIYNAILSTLNESADSGASGKHHRVQRVMKTVQSVTDWPQLWAFIRETGNFEMLQKRLSDKAAAEWAEANGTQVPGVGEREIATLSFTKI